MTEPAAALRFCLQLTEQPQNENNDQNRSQNPMRSVAKAITAGGKSAQQQQDDNDEKD